MSRRLRLKPVEYSGSGRQGIPLRLYEYSDACCAKLRVYSESYWNSLSAQTCVFHSPQGLAANARQALPVC